MKKIFSTVALAVGALMLLGSSACAKKQPFPAAPAYSGHPEGKFPLLATYAFHDPFITDEQFRLLAEAGFNSICPNLSISQLDSTLKLAEKYDLYVVDAFNNMNDGKQVDAYIARYAENPRLWGFKIKDEPDASLFAPIAGVNEKVVKRSPRKNAFINLYPAVGAEMLGAKDYQTYVEDFVRTVNPQYISFDSYPVRQEKDGSLSVSDMYFRSIETVADVARRSDRPFWSYILINKHGNYPTPSLATVRFQMFAALAYGAQGMAFYTYLVPNWDKKGENTATPIDLDGRPTPTWDIVRKVNGEVNALADVFLGAKVKDVRLTGARLPQGTRRLRTLPKPFRMIEGYGEGLIVSHLQNNGKEYILLVNRDVEKPQNVRIGTTQTVTRLLPDGSEDPRPAAYFALDPGSFALFRLPN